jgi:hypothetical protein
LKINLIIDGNYLLYKDVFILKKSRAIHTDLKELLMNDFKKLSKSHSFNNIYFVSDSPNSWRKNVYPEYKGNRKKDDTIDWDFVYKIYTEFKKIVEKLPNVKFLEQEGLEGDDFIAHIVRETNKNDFSNVIVASDGDLNQLLEYDIEKSYMNIQWNYKFNDERLYLPQNYQLLIDKMVNSVNHNIFELDNSGDFVEYIDKLITRTTIKEVLSEECIFKKIVQGDTGDNVPTLIKIKGGYMDPEGRGIGKSGAETIYKYYKEMYPDDIDFKSSEFIENLIEVVFYYKKIKDNSAKDVIRKNAMFNIKMMVLDKEYMPKLVYENMNEYYQEVENRVVEYKIEDLDKKLEEDGYFDDVEEDIPENFRIDEISDNKEEQTFNPDDFWEL